MNGYARMSSLDFVLEDNLDTIPADKGVFLNVTRRLNKKICKLYISLVFMILD